MGKFFDWKTVTMVLVALMIWYYVSPMLEKAPTPPATGDGTTNGNGHGKGNGGA